MIFIITNNVKARDPVGSKNNCDICPLGDADGTQAVGGDEVACVDHGFVFSLSLCFLCSVVRGKILLFAAMQCFSI